VTALDDLTPSERAAVLAIDHLDVSGFCAIIQRAQNSGRARAEGIGLPSRDRRGRFAEILTRRPTMASIRVFMTLVLALTFGLALPVAAQPLRGTDLVTGLFGGGPFVEQLCESLLRRLCPRPIVGGEEGESNTALGAGALGSNTTGSENTAVGGDALGSNTTGIGNTATGGPCPLQQHHR
jgi:hypothetical protein